MIFPDKLQFHIITLSDRASRGEYEDRSGPQIRLMIDDYFGDKEYSCNISGTLIPDDPDQLKACLEKLAMEKTHVVFTTGGTGIGPKDFTPDVVKNELDKEIPGIMEMIRVKYGMQKPNALISRSIAGVMKSTLVYALPGSVKAVKEYCDEILPTIIHSMMMIHGIDDHSK